MTLSPTSRAPFPPLTHERLSKAVAELATHQTDRALSAQLHALSAALRAIPDSASTSAVAERDDVVQSLEAALANNQQEDILRHARRLTRMDRAVVPQVDWTAVSGG